MPLEIGKPIDYPSGRSVSGERMIKTPVTLFGRKKDSFSHGASSRTTKIEDSPRTYKDMK